MSTLYITNELHPDSTDGHSKNMVAPTYICRLINNEMFWRPTRHIHLSTLHEYLWPLKWPCKNSDGLRSRNAFAVIDHNIHFLQSTHYPTGVVSIFLSGRRFFLFIVFPVIIGPSPSKRTDEKSTIHYYRMCLVNVSYGLLPIILSSISGNWRKWLSLAPNYI